MFRLTILFLIVNVSLSTVKCFCDKNLPEVRLLRNVEKLLNRDSLQILNGINLRRKTNVTVNLRNSTSICNEVSRNFIEEVDNKLTQVLKTHVLEFDLASLLSNGKEEQIL